MKNTDKVTLTVGQIKKLIKEAKSPRQAFDEIHAGLMDEYEDAQYITYNDIFDELEGIDEAELEELFNDNEAVDLIADHIMDSFPMAENGDLLNDAILEVAEYLLSGLSIQKMRTRMGKQEI